MQTPPGRQANHSASVMAFLMRGWASLADKTLDEPPSPEVAYSSCCLLPKRSLVTRRLK